MYLKCTVSITLMDLILERFSPMLGLTAHENILNNGLGYVNLLLKNICSKELDIKYISQFLSN